MTLGEIVELICIKSHRTDEQSKTEARAYIRARYQMLWDSRPWRDSLGLLTVPAEEVTRITIFPGVIDRIQAVRWGDSSTLLPEDLGVTFFVDPVSFERQGTPAKFSIISPSGTSKAPAGGKVLISSSDDNASYGVTIRGMIGNVERSEVIAVAGVSEVESEYPYDSISSISKSSVELDMTVKDAEGNEILFLSANESSRSFQRVQFHSQPTEAKALLVLFKRRCSPLVEDSDATELAGVDNALLAAALSDMLEGSRQFGKAQIKMQESGMMSQAMADLERNQSASSISIVPWDAAMSPDEPWRN